MLYDSKTIVVAVFPTNKYIKVWFTFNVFLENACFCALEGVVWGDVNVARLTERRSKNGLRRIESAIIDRTFAETKIPNRFRPGILSYKTVVQLLASAAWLQLFEEVVAFVVDQNEGWEVLNLNLPNGLHTEFGVLHALNALNVVLRQNGSGAAD